MTKKKTKQSARSRSKQELDSVFFLKLLMYLILGTQWLRVIDDAGAIQYSLPVGLVVGVTFALHDHFRIDRKIEFAVLLIAALIGFFAMIGISLSL